MTLTPAFSVSCADCRKAFLPRGATSAEICPHCGYLHNLLQDRAYLKKTAVAVSVGCELPLGLVDESLGELAFKTYYRQVFTSHAQPKWEWCRPDDKAAWIEVGNAIMRATCGPTS